MELSEPGGTKKREVASKFTKKAASFTVPSCGSKKDENDDGTAPRKDIHNPDAKLKNTRILNLRILHHLEWDTENKEWKNGAIYDPDNGKTYTCFATLQKDGKMFLKGYVMGMRFLGRSTLWTKFDK